MVRKKVRLEWIANDNARRASFKKRRLGLLKKVSELTTLCGVNAFAIIYSPDKIQPVVWPSLDVVKLSYSRFQSMFGLDRLQKMVNQETYLKDKVSKAQEKLVKCQRKNKEIEMAHLIHQINHGKRLDILNLSELCGLTWWVEEKMEEIKKHIEFFQNVPCAHIGAPHHSHLPLPFQGLRVNEMVPIDGGNTNHGGDERTPSEHLSWDQWFTDMMNNNEFSSTSISSIRNAMVLPHHPSARSVAVDLGQLEHSFIHSSSVAVDMRLPL